MRLHSPCSSAAKGASILDPPLGQITKPILYVIEASALKYDTQRMLVLQLSTVELSTVKLCAVQLSAVQRSLTMGDRAVPSFSQVRCHNFMNRCHSMTQRLQ